MSGLRDWWTAGDGRRIRAFALALAVALLGSQTLEAAGIVSLRGTLYLQPTFSWLLIPLGGLLFGYGMVLANGCGARALVLLGSGNLRSFVVLVCLGIAAYATLSGVLAPVRVWVAGWSGVSVGVAPPSLAGLLAESGLGPGTARWLPTLLLAGGLAVVALGSPAFRRSRRDLLGGLVIGLLVPAGWYATGALGADPFEPAPVNSLTFVAPVGEAIQYLMLSTGTALRFGVAVVAGVLLGAAATALVTRRFAWQGFPTPQRILRSMAGGCLMGIGGALALGCSIGQGLTGVSTLALSSFLAAGGILAGAALALRGPLRAPDLQKRP